MSLNTAFLLMAQYNGKTLIPLVSLNQERLASPWCELKGLRSAPRAFILMTWPHTSANGVTSHCPSCALSAGTLHRNRKRISSGDSFAPSFRSSSAPFLQFEWEAPFRARDAALAKAAQGCAAPAGILGALRSRQAMHAIGLLAARLTTRWPRAHREERLARRRPGSKWRVRPIRRLAACSPRQPA